MSPHYIMTDWYLNRPDYLTKMIEKYETDLKEQEQYQLCQKAKLAHRVQLSPTIFPTTLPRVPKTFLNDVSKIYKTMSGNSSDADNHSEHK